MRSLQSGFERQTDGAASARATPAVAYLRRSTDRQEQSIGDQRNENMRWAAEHGYEIVRDFVDDAISGTSADGRR